MIMTTMMLMMMAKGNNDDIDEFQKRPDFLEWTEKYAVSEDDENFDDGPLYPPHPYNRFRR